MKKKNFSGKLLIIEDDIATQEAVLLKFSQEGYDADCAENGEEGLKKLRRGKYHCVLLDLKMPKVDGFIFLENKQKIKALKDIPVVVFSNYGQPEFVKRAMDLGATEYLIKAQYNIQEMVDRTIKCCLSKSKRGVGAKCKAII